MSDLSLISEFEVHYHSPGELFLSRSLDQELDVVNFAFYLDYVVCALSEELAREVSEKLFRVADYLYRHITEDGVLPQQLPTSFQLGEKSGSRSTQEPPISTVLTLLQEPDGQYSSSISVDVETIRTTPELFVEALETIFFELLEQGSEQSQHLLAVLIMSQSSWYLDKGIPDLHALGVAPNAALEFVGELTQVQ